MKRVMKKIIVFAASIMLLFSCNKSESDSIIEETSTLPLIKAYVEDPLETKTTYDKVGSSYVFSWVTGDVVSVRLVKSGPYYDRWEYKAQTSDASTTLSPDSTPGGEWSLSDYAFYPKPGTLGFNYTNDHENSGPSISLGDINNVEQSNPYKAIPLIGVNKGDNTYAFKAATGVLKVTYTKLPTSLAGQTLALQIVAGQNGGSTYVNGTCAFPADHCTLSITSSGSNQKMIYCTVTDPSEVSFYVPIPECTIAAKDMKFTLWNSSLGWFFDHFVNPKQIDIVRGVVTELPVIDYAAVQGSLSYTGNLAAPKVTLSKGPRVAKVKYTVATDVSTGNSNLDSDINVVSLTTNGETLVPTPASTGSYYIVYRVYNSKEELITSGSFPFAYISSTISEVAGTYDIASVGSNWGLVLAEETSEPGYNVKITQYISNNDTYNGISGNVYGVLDREAGTLSFAKDQILSKSANTYYVVGAATIYTGSVCTPNDYLIFQVQNIVGKSNKLVFYCSTKFGIVDTDHKGTGQQFNPTYYYQK